MTTCFYSDGHNSASLPRKKNNTASSGLVKDIQRVWRVPDGAELHRDPSTLLRCCSSSIRRIHIQRLPASSVPMKIATALFCATCSHAAVWSGLRRLFTAVHVREAAAKEAAARGCERLAVTLKKPAEEFESNIIKCSPSGIIRMENSAFGHMCI